MHKSLSFSEPVVLLCLIYYLDLLPDFYNFMSSKIVGWSWNRFYFKICSIPIKAGAHSTHNTANHLIYMQFLFKQWIINHLSVGVSNSIITVRERVRLENIMRQDAIGHCDRKHTQRATRGTWGSLLCPPLSLSCRHVEQQKQIPTREPRRSFFAHRQRIRAG